MLPLVYLFLSFFKARDSERRITVGQTRDGLPAWQVTGALLDSGGYGMGDVLLNYPPPPGREKEMLEIDCSHLRSVDAVVTSTRAAPNDEAEGGRRTIPQGYTSLEVILNSVWDLYVVELSRQILTLQPWLRGMIRENYESRRDVRFMLSERAEYKQLNAFDGRGPRKVSGIGRTAAFLVNQPALWPGGPRYIGFFGMDGASTLAWAYLLRHRHSDLLFRPGFHMVELVTAPIPERVPDLRWALDWQAEILLSVPPAELPSSVQPPGPRLTKPGPKNVSARASRGETRA